MVDEAMRFLIDHIKAAKQQERERWWKGGAEVLIVDDGSTDDTARVAEALASTWEKEGGQVGVEVRVVQLERNRGKGGAVRHGVLFSRGRRILFADADGASTFADLTLLQRAMDKLLDSPTSNGHAVVVGSRAHMVNSDAVVKLFTRTTARTLFPTLHLHRWSFDVELLLLAQILRLPIAEVSIRWHEVPGSKINVGWDGLGMARDLVVLRGNLALGRWVVPKVVMNDDEEEEKVER
ncbi:hypothetical protein QFC21_001314 [Naganishia friedmannii]|uniref:Uncharacterized protein n=1 Tax=Naganishia friedmannii TaxID=89922 RepID=A0ACC2W530_9TREE|nr:hypothetical protein QFC21_001314 [Naganishia friedmannii]